MKKLVSGLILAIIILSGCQISPAPKSSALVPDVSQPAGTWEVGGNLTYSEESIWGDMLAGLEATTSDNLSEGKQGQVQRIIIYDLKMRRQQRVIGLPAERVAEPPSIYGSKLVFASVDRQEFFRYVISSVIKPEPNYDVFIFDMETNRMQQITTDEHAQKFPRIYGDTVVWLDNRHEADAEYPHNYDVYAYDLKTGQERRITTTNSITEQDLSINGSLVVWTDSRNDDLASRIQVRPPIHNDDIYLYDLSTNQERRITTDPAQDSSPVIDNGRIVWKRMVAIRNVDIFLYDIETEQEMKISQSRYAVSNYYPAIYGERIVWADSRITLGNSAGDVGGIDVSGNAASGAAEIYLYDLRTKQETLLVPSVGANYTGESGPKRTSYQVLLNPVIHGDYIVYTDTGQVNSIVYAVELKNTFQLILELSNQKTTLAAAAKATGKVVPVPSYLPEGYEIKEVYLAPMKDAIPAVKLLISDIPIEKRMVTQTDAAGTRERYEVQSRMYMYIRWVENGFVISPYKDPKLIGLVPINENQGYLSGNDDGIGLWWTLQPEPDGKAIFEFHIVANKDVSEEELINIAKSVEAR